MKTAFAGLIFSTLLAGGYLYNRYGDSDEHVEAIVRRSLEKQGIHADYFYRGKANGAAERHYGYKHCVLFGADAHWSESIQDNVEGTLGYACSNDWRGPYVIVNRR